MGSPWPISALGDRQKAARSRLLGLKRFLLSADVRLSPLKIGTNLEQAMVCEESDWSLKSRDLGQFGVGTNSQGALPKAVFLGGVIGPFRN